MTKMKWRSLRGFIIVCAYILASSANAACIEHGGDEFCVSGVPATIWKYSLCDDTGPYMYRIRIWCEVQGGTWVAAPMPYCVDAQPVTDENVSPWSHAFANEVHQTACSETSDTGWGSSATSYNCWSGPTRYDKGISVWEVRNLSYICPLPSGIITTEDIVALKNRQAQCPAGSIAKSENGISYCAIPRDETCAIGNPVKPGSGEKVFGRYDYRDVHGLSLTRQYRSTGIHVPISFIEKPPLPMGEKWWFGESRWLSPLSATGSVLAGQIEANGGFTLYGPSGVNLPYQSARRLVRSGDTTYIVRGQSIDSYDSHGRLQLSVESNGRKLHYIYSDGTLAQGAFIIDGSGMPTAALLPEGLLISIETEEQTRIAFQYDASLLLRRALLPGGLELQYHYDSQNNLSQVVYPDGTTETYHYDNGSDATLLSGITDATGTRYATYVYNNDKKVAHTFLAGNVQEMRYTYFNDRTRVADPLGTERDIYLSRINNIIRETSQTQPGGSGCSASTRGYSYDAQGNIISRTDFDEAVTTYSYESTRNLEIKRVQASGTPQARTISTQWHPFWALKTAQAEPGLITRWVYNGQPDPYGIGISRCAPENANVIDDVPIAVVCRLIEQPTTDTTGASGFSAGRTGTVRIWDFEYDERGNLIREKISGQPGSTEYTYWPIDAQCPNASGAPDLDKGCRGQLHTRNIHTSPAKNYIFEYRKYDAHGNILEMAEQNGAVTTFEYDQRQRPVRRTHAGVTVSWDYDVRGLLIRSAITEGPTLEYEYDPAHRLIGIRDQDGNRISYTLDAAGNPVNEQITDASGELYLNIDRQYDALSRLAREQRGI